MKLTGIKISDIWKSENGKLVPDEKKIRAKKAVCDRFPKRKAQIRVGKRAASSVNRPV